MNEIYDDVDHPYEILDGLTFDEIKTMSDEGDSTAIQFVEKFEAYHVTIVQLSDCKRDEEFNLQFTRLNLGQLIVSGEKLNAMVGDLRDACFERIGQHDLLSMTRIPKRRFAWQQLAAQIVAQIFTYELTIKTGEREFARIRHLDLQLLFKEYAEMGNPELQWIDGLEEVMNVLVPQSELLNLLRSRSIVLSLVLFAYELGIDEDENVAAEFAKFALTFSERLREQISPSTEVSADYSYLHEFQRHLTQASGEKHSIGERARILTEQFEFWKRNARLQGDDAQV